jgi:hypothetical protein
MRTTKFVKAARKQVSTKRLLKLVGGKKKCHRSVTKFLKAVDKTKGVIGTVAAGLGTADVAMEQTTGCPTSRKTRKI